MATTRSSTRDLIKTAKAKVDYVFTALSELQKEIAGELDSGRMQQVYVQLKEFRVMIVDTMAQVEKWEKEGKSGLPKRELATSCLHIIADLVSNLESRSVKRSFSVPIRTADDDGTRVTSIPLTRSVSPSHFGENPELTDPITTVFTSTVRTTHSDMIKTPITAPFTIDDSARPSVSRLFSSPNILDFMTPKVIKKLDFKFPEQPGVTFSNNHEIQCIRHINHFTSGYTFPSTSGQTQSTDFQLPSITYNTPSTSNNYNNNNRTNQSSAGTTGVKQCFFCKGNHIPTQCPRPSREKIRILNSLKRCLRCFSMAHMINECRNTFTCRTCNEKIKITLNGKEFEGLYDTGATHSFISCDICDVLQITPEPCDNLVRQAGIPGGKNKSIIRKIKLHDLSQIDDPLKIDFTNFSNDLQHLLLNSKQILSRRSQRQRHRHDPSCPPQTPTIKAMRGDFAGGLSRNDAYESGGPYFEVPSKPRRDVMSLLPILVPVFAGSDQSCMASGPTDSSRKSGFMGGLMWKTSDRSRVSMFPENRLTAFSCLVAEFLPKQNKLSNRETFYFALSSSLPTIIQLEITSIFSFIEHHP
ncbi:hypothetical protein HUG17_0481 [Dermatophagoides farinae]|uniref:Uncharacterized protein n=1 Tax=Dermatophagoides farinae TaxID=6954 RepID=A0A9D4P6G5_DERFA|nr:hypothetical protein HUG17_0481 [Dermatophagoides farinae]